MADKKEYIVVTKFAHFKPNDIVEFDDVPSAAYPHVKLLDSKRDKAEDESIGVLRDLHESITGKSAHPKAGASKISANILEFLSKDTDEGNTGE